MTGFHKRKLQRRKEAQECAAAPAPLCVVPPAWVPSQDSTGRAACRKLEEKARKLRLEERAKARARRAPARAAHGLLATEHTPTEVLEFGNKKGECNFSRVQCLGASACKWVPPPSTLFCLCCVEQKRQQVRAQPLRQHTAMCGGSPESQVHAKQRGAAAGRRRSGRSSARGCSWTATRRRRRRATRRRPARRARRRACSSMRPAACRPRSPLRPSPCTGAPAGGAAVGIVPCMPHAGPPVFVQRPLGDLWGPGACYAWQDAAAAAAGRRLA